MANSFTANLNLEKPEVGADTNLWGGHLNSDLDILDSIFTSATTRPQSTIIKSDTKIVDVTTTSKAILFALNNITAATTRTITAQNTSGTMAFLADVATSTTGLVTTGQVAAATVGFMDLTSVQTATNKTLTAPLLNGAILDAASTGVTTTALSNNTKLATTAYADNNLIQFAATTTTGPAAMTGTLKAIGGAITSGAGASVPGLSAVSFTPKSASSWLGITIRIRGTPNATDNFMAAIFNGTTLVDFFPAMNLNAGASAFDEIGGTTWLFPATTTTLTFQARIGANGGNAFLMNQANSGVITTQVGSVSSMIIQEILPHP